MENFTNSMKYLALIVILFLITSGISYSQSTDHDGKFGIQLNGVLGLTEFKEYEDFKPGYLGRAFLRFGLTNSIETELGGGYGLMTGNDFGGNYYETLILPFDVRFLVRPFNSTSFNPYLFAGIGVLGYEVKDFPTDQRPAMDETGNGWEGIVPLGLGFEFEIGKDVMLDLNGSFTYSFTDDLNHYSRGANDAYATVGLGLVFVTNSGSSDRDKDGLTRAQEELYGTNHENSDSDLDGLPDGKEVNELKTNPTSSDTDNDGINDGEEFNKYQTNPRLADTDSDGLSDKDEITEYNTDPLKSDTDGDGLNDSDEVSVHKTNPVKDDSDADGLNDKEEVSEYKTDPNKADSDGDGLNDGEEVKTYKSNPLNIDTDGGSVSDRTELRRGTNPLDSEDDVVKVDVPMILEGVTFASGKSDITPESAIILQKALKTLETYKDIIVEIRGYTDNVGRKSSNIKLSQKRADSVRNWMVENGVDGSRINAVGYGPDNPIVPNNSTENRRKNRRIEFVRVK